jgi:hypothetical protein
MNGRQIARPAVTRLCAIAMLAATTVTTLGQAGPAAAATEHHVSRTRAVTLTTLVRGVAVRSKPTSASKLAGRIKERGARVTVQCYAPGARFAGNPIWYLVSKPLRGYVTSYNINSHEDPASGVARCADTKFSRTYHTLVRGVHIRSWPTSTSTRLRTLSRMGSKVTITCYVTGQKTGGDSIWYHTVRPLAGFVSGSLLNTGHDPAFKVPACW